MQTGYAGGAIFEWADEWCKGTSLDNAYMIPFDRHAYWHDLMDPEQNYGLAAYDPYTPDKPETYWQQNDRQVGDEIKGIKVNHDDAFTYLELDFFKPVASELLHGAQSDLELDIGIDTIGRGNGTVRLPVDGLPQLPGGVEFLLRINAKDGGLLLAVPDYNLATTKFAAAHSTSTEFDHIRFVVNQERLNTLNGAIIPEQYTDDSVLHYGVYETTSKDYDSLGNWYASPDGRKLYVRLPWQLLNVSDPSSLTVLHDDRTDLPVGPMAVKNQMGTDELRTEQTAGFSFYAAVTRGGKLSDFGPNSGDDWAGVDKYLWQGWDVPTYKARQKLSCPVIESLYGGSSGE